jgi:hypothetical protein
MLNRCDDQADDALQQNTQKAKQGLDSVTGFRRKRLLELVLITYYTEFVSTEKIALFWVQPNFYAIKNLFLLLLSEATEETKSQVGEKILKKTEEEPQTLDRCQKVLKILHQIRQQLCWRYPQSTIDFS